MKHDLALPPPGAIEPEGKPSKDVKIGQKPVLPPPAKPLDEDDLRRAAQKPKSDVPLAERPPPVQGQGPLDMKVQPGEGMPPPKRQPPQEMKSEKSKSSLSKVKKKKKRPVSMMDDEVAVVTRDPRKPRGE